MAAKNLNTDSSPGAAPQGSPYPFFVELRGTGEKISGSALHLAPHGLMLEANSGVLKVGETWGLFLELPESMGEFEVSVNIVRTIDRQVPSSGGPRIQRIVEVHFTEALKGRAEQLVKRFLKEYPRIDNHKA